MRGLSVLILSLLPIYLYGQEVKPELRDTVLLVHQDYTAVKQIQRVLVRQGTHEMILAEFPETVDPASILLDSREVDFTVRSWRKGGTDNSKWIPTVSSGTRGTYPVQVLYLCDGINWKADYDIRFRFSSEDKPQVACSIHGSVALENSNHYDFQKAQVRLIQPDHSVEVEAEEESSPGFFIMDPVSPLSDLWTNPDAKQKPVDQEILLNRRVTLPAGEEIKVQLVNSQRVRAKRLFRNDIHQKYLSEESMLQIMVIENTAENGLGFTLPGGRLRMEGSQNRVGLLGESVWPHTLKGESAEIFIGTVDLVTAKRLPDRLIRRFSQGYETDFRIQLINRYDFPVEVEWIERPESSYSWSVLTANVPHLVEQRKLIFRPTIEAGGELLLQFQLQYKRPQL